MSLHVSVSLSLVRCTDITFWVFLFQGSLCEMSLHVSVSLSLVRCTDITFWVFLFQGSLCEMSLHVLVPLNIGMRHMFGSGTPSLVRCPFWLFW